MELIQSFVYTISRTKLSLYEQRILLMIVKHAQTRLKGMLIKDNMFKLPHEFENVLMTIPIKEILTDGSQHYAQVRAAAKTLSTRPVEMLDTDSGAWFSTPLIYNISHESRSGVLRFYVSRRLFDTILDFSKGFRQYSLETALSLGSPYASRLYALMCGQDKPIQLGIEPLKTMFGVQDKYKQTRDFILKVIDPAKAILDKAGCTSFEYTKVTKGQKVIALLFRPVLRDPVERSQLLAQISVSQLMPKEIKIQLMQQANFSLRELNSHKALMDDFARISEPLAILADIVNRAQLKGKAKGWIINAMRSEVEKFKSTQVQD